ncbi:hypothetical protein chiPu_0022964 [Chiloscyllium punctatum]|uniref:Uncharacterized protein n=1 Tax=Chiloscyllium punctatum TaxID=137246 RepID=A0A401T9Y0_CHIPU|nr:hypothetical protein [Chiloscyllium punctatum]
MTQQPTRALFDDDPTPSDPAGSRYEVSACDRSAVSLSNPRRALTLLEARGLGSAGSSSLRRGRGSLQCRRGAEGESLVGGG